MPGIVDELLIRIGLDPSKLLQGQKQAQAATTQLGASAGQLDKSFDIATKRIVAGFQRIRNEMLALFAVVTTGRGLKELVADITQTDAATGQYARTLGMTTQDLDAWQQLAIRGGSSAGAMTQSLQGLNTELQRFNITGQMAPETVQAFNRLNLNPIDTATGKIKDLGTIYREVAGALQGKSDQEAMFIGSGLRLDPNVALMLKQLGPQGIAQGFQKQQALGLTSDEDAKRARELLNDVADLQQAFYGVARTVLNDVSPAIDALLKRLIAWIEANGPRIRTEITEQIQQAFAWITAHWGDFEQGASKAVEALKSIATAFENLSPTMQHVVEIAGVMWATGFLGPIARVTASLLGLGTALTGLTAAALPALAPLLALGAGTAAGAGIAGKWGYDIEKFLFGQERADQHAREGGLTGHWFENLFGIKPQGSGSEQETQDGFIRRWIDAMRGLLPQLNPVGSAGAAELGAGGGPGQDALGSPEMQAREKQAFDYFKSQGWSAEQSAGIVANLRKESGFREGAVGDNGAAFGIAQWHGDRQRALEAAGFDLRGGGFQRQLEAYQYELTQGGERRAGEMLRRAQTASDSGAIVSTYDERPAARSIEEVERADLARRILRRQTGGSIQAPMIVGSNATRHGAIRASHVSNDNSNETHIGAITINTQATDAKGIAGSLQERLASMTFATQANRGLA